MRTPKTLVHWLRNKGWLATDLEAVFVQEAPDNDSLDGRTLYVERRSGFIKWAHLACPKCDELISLPIGDKKDSWIISVDWLWRPTLRPSIWETESCGAHFFVTAGEVLWCRDNVRSPPGFCG